MNPVTNKYGIKLHVVLFIIKLYAYINIFKIKNLLPSDASPNVRSYSVKCAIIFISSARASSHYGALLDLLLTLSQLYSAYLTAYPRTR